MFPLNKKTIYIVPFLILLIYGNFIHSYHVNVHKFEDNWNYEVRISKDPIINKTGKIHMLPSALNEELDFEEFQSDQPSARKSGRNFKSAIDPVRSIISCPICRIGVSLLKREVDDESTFDEIKDKFVGLCVTLKVQIESVCKGIFNVYGPDVLAVLKLIDNEPMEICSLMLGEACGEINNPQHEWNVTFPNTTIRDEIVGNTLYPSEIPKPGLPTFKVLQISDTHYDPQYVAGSLANCLEPLCCHNNSTPVQGKRTETAGKWGSYRKCDVPKVFIDSMLKSIAEEHPDIDYILWTGDLPAHDIWNQTKSSNLDIIGDTVDQMFEVFPMTPIFPSLGNHESVPPGSFAPPWMHDRAHSMDWLYERASNHWRRWLPASTCGTLLHGGFYSILIRPGFRLISLNTNYCSTFSWWLMLNSTDPAKELQWLIHELQSAEDANEKVHLIGHIAPGSVDCMKVWSRNFHRIVERYQHTIQAQFYAHSHADEFEVFYEDSKERKPINVAYLSPSVTTYENFNPAYRIYYIDGDHEATTREVIDHETWTVNLDEANKNPNAVPKWYRLYSARSAYRMKSLRPEAWATLIEQLIQNPKIFDKFYRHYYRDSLVRPVCDKECKVQILCDLKCAKSHQRREQCGNLESQIYG